MPLDRPSDKQPSLFPRGWVEVEIFGRRYRLRGEQMEAAYLQELAAEVDRRMWEVAQRTHDAAPSRVAVLVALSLVHELRELEARLNHREQEVASRTRALLHWIEQHLDETTPA